MKVTQPQSIQQQLTSLFHPITDITFKTYFSYLGIFKGGTMFALYKDGHLYLRKSKQYLDEIAQTIPLYFLTDINSGLRTRIFYHIPTSFLSQLTNHLHWITAAIDEYQASKDKINKHNQHKIRNMLNLNLNIERLLNKVQIHTAHDLSQLGAIQTTIRLIEQGFDVTPLLLFKLYGAIHHKYIALLPNSLKKSLLYQADSALQEANYRKRFTL